MAQTPRMSPPLVSGAACLGVVLALQLIRQCCPQAEYLFSILDSTLGNFKVLGAPLQSFMIAALAIYLFPSAMSRMQTSQSEAKGAAHEPTLGEKLVRHFQSHRISFSSNTAWQKEATGRGKQSLLRRLVGRLQFGRQQQAAPIRRPRLDGPLLRRSSSNRSTSSRRSGEGFAMSSSSSPSMRVSLDGSLGLGRSVTGGMLGTLLASLRRPLSRALPLATRARPNGSVGGAPPSRGGRWQPSMARIASGSNLVGGIETSSSMSEATNAGPCGQNIPLIPYNGHLAADCLGNDMIDPEIAEVKQIVTEDHLLQFGAFLGESSAQLALSQRGAPGPIGPMPASLYGEMDANARGHKGGKDGSAGGWEMVVEEHKPGIHYWAWRHMMRSGLYMYRSRTVYERCTTHQMVAFTFDGNKRRREWDESSMELRPIAPTSRPNMPPEELEERCYVQSSYMYARCKFPPPMAQREYIYSRRIWYKADDGGCYAISRTCTHPSPPPAGCRTVAVQDFCSGFVIRAVPGIYEQAPAVEVVTNYFEDPKVSSGLCNMAVRKALWPMIQKSEAGLRKFVAQYYDPAVPKPPSLPLSHRSPKSAACSRRQSLDLAARRMSLEASRGGAALPPLAPAPSPAGPGHTSRLADLSPAPPPADTLLMAAADALGAKASRAGAPPLAHGLAVVEEDDTVSSFPVAVAPEPDSFPVPVAEEAPQLPDSFPVPVADGCANDEINSYPLATAPSLADLDVFANAQDPGSGCVDDGLYSHEYSTLDVLLEQDGEGEDEDEDDVIPVIPASWGGYYPALTRRFHFTPLLYRTYLSAWALGSRLCRGSWLMLRDARTDIACLLRSCAKAAVAAHKHGAAAVVSGCRELGRRLGGALARAASRLRRGSPGAAESVPLLAQKTLSSHPIVRSSTSRREQQQPTLKPSSSFHALGSQAAAVHALSRSNSDQLPDVGQRGPGLTVDTDARGVFHSGAASPAGPGGRSPRVSNGGGGPSSGGVYGMSPDSSSLARNRNASWGRRAAMRVASVAVKAVGLPLAHQFLSSRSSSMNGISEESLPPSLGPSRGSSFSSQQSGAGGAAGAQASLPHQQQQMHKLARWPLLVPAPKGARPLAVSPAGTAFTGAPSGSASVAARATVPAHPFKQPFGPKRKTAMSGGGAATPTDPDSARVFGRRSMN